MYLEGKRTALFLVIQDKFVDEDAQHDNRERPCCGGEDRNKHHRMDLDTGYTLTDEGVPLPSDATPLTVYPLLKTVPALIWGNGEEPGQGTGLLLHWAGISRVVRLFVCIIYMWNIVA